MTRGWAEAASFSALVGGLVEPEVVERVAGDWWLAFNATGEPALATRGAEPIPPLSAYVEFQGRPAAVLFAHDGLFVRPAAEVMDALSAMGG